MSDWRSHDAAQPFAQKRKRELDSGKAVSYGHRYDATKHEREQEVRDEHGRRRLHGAFTGGFTAGYFGTVGSKEGWAPSSFVSSRAQRAQVSSNVMDFMDAEDIADLEETMDFRAAREAQKQPAPIEQEEQLRTHEESDIVEILPKQVDARQKRQSQAGGMSTVSLMQEQDDDIDGYDIGPKITYDKTLAKQKKVKPKAATAVHTFQSSKIAKAKVAQRQALLNDLDGATIVQEAVTESSRLPEDTTDATIKRTSAYKSTAKKQLSASQSDSKEAIAASSNVPPWRQKPSTQAALTASRAGPPLEMSSAKAALTSTFDPYAQNPQKSQRYRAYLSQEAVVSVPEHRNLASLAPDVFESELAEFHRAALMFGSSAGAMASRFTSATGQTQTDVPEVHVAFEAQIEAAHAGRFGHRTRVIESWFPTRLLCKRFGVPDPHPEGKASAAVDTYESRAEIQLERRMQIEQLMQGPAPASAQVEASPEILKSSTMKKSGEGQQTSKAFQELFKDDSDDD